MGRNFQKMRSRSKILDVNLCIAANHKMGVVNEKSLRSPELNYNYYIKMGNTEDCGFKSHQGRVIKFLSNQPEKKPEPSPETLM